MKLATERSIQIGHSKLYRLIVKHMPGFKGTPAVKIERHPFTAADAIRGRKRKLVFKEIIEFL